MPCTYDESPEERAQNAVERNARLEEQLGLATRLLCELCFQLEEGSSPRWNDDLEEWWNKHREMDKKRRAREDKERKEKIAELETRRAELDREIKRLSVPSKNKK